MNLLQIAAKITTPLSLVAFIAALVFYAYRWRLAERRKTLELASAKDRPPLIESAIRDFTILHTDSLSNDQKYRLIESELKNRMRRFLIAAIVAVIVTLASAVTFLVFEKKEQPRAAAAQDQSRAITTSDQAKPTAGGEQPNPAKNSSAGPPLAKTVPNPETVPTPAKTQPAPNNDLHFVDSGPADLVSLRHHDQVRDLSDRDAGKPLSAVPTGVLAFIPPWLIPCASSYQIGVDQVPGGTSVLELHKLPNGQTNVVVFVSPKDAGNIKARQTSLRVSAFAERWAGEAGTPVSIPLSEIVSCEPVSTASHGERLDLVLGDKSSAP